ncbi:MULTISPECIES: HD domain-containing protein [Anoxybacillus]|uniref:HD domain-containing protein n=1 Tax=Anoxybacillus flavithermus TaxID=33934 RepID=A0A2G5RUG4_9BACL|nr:MULTISPECIES: HD domain-containing protein [Anoxybacillus]AXM88199.1 HD domain-containing protein [Anoxybacillus ayderensis G10]KHF27665.1 putative nicotinate-nucleotide adenylyltransferase [Anoxybacillus sp. BCO1]MCX8001971.1 HD domain-containing protein [Anoxybacillus mongoliensis]EMI09193.1 HD superfamily hydrolase [Anoxybacillus gonensis]KFZ42251.1 phosphohydrolase [Anoxybacillus sp. KU2-6(11)]
MRRVTLTDIFLHPITQKYLKRSGVAHAIATAYHAYRLALQYGVNVDLATKAALLHDIGHYEWYSNGTWDYETYKQNDIHAIKGAERAHKLLIRLGEHPQHAKEIALAILLHTDSYLPEGELKRKPLQTIVKLADEADEEPGGKHHYRQIDDELALKKIQQLDRMVEQQLQRDALDQIS